MGITALWQKGAPFRPKQPPTGLRAGSPAKPALQPRLRGAGRPLLVAVQPLPKVLRVLGSSYRSACSAGYWEVVREGRSGDSEGV